MIARQARRDLLHMRQRMSRFERRNNAFEPRQLGEGIERFFVGDRDILDAMAVMEPGMLGPDAGIVEPGRDRMPILSSVLLAVVLTT